MIGDLLVKLNQLLSRNSKKLFFGLAIIVLILLFGISKLKVSESIFTTLPKGKDFQEFNSLVESKNLINQVVFSVGWNETNSEIEPADLLEIFNDSLKLASDSLLTKIITRRVDSQEKVYEYTLRNFPALIDASYFESINSKINPDSIAQAIYRVKNQLIAPGGSFLKQIILKDPLGITYPYLQTLNQNNNTAGLQIEDGIIFDAKRENVLVTATLGYATGNSKQDVILFNKLNRFQNSWNKAYPLHKMVYFGTFEIAAKNAIQVKKDTYYTSIVAFILIIILLVWYYRKVSIPVMLLLPGVFGGIFALGVTGFVQPEISGISLAMGAVIFGILLDYAIHFFTHYRHTKSISIVIKELSAPLLTGSFTTILAFGALTFANSKILVDFGLFAALGLLGASLFTVIILPVILQFFNFDFLASEKKPTPFWPHFQPNKLLKRTFLFLFILLTGLFLYEAQFTEFDASFENLSIQSDEIKQRENALTGLNPKHEKRIYLFAKSENIDSAQKINYEVFTRLQELQKQKSVTSFSSTGNFLVPKITAKQRIEKWHHYWKSQERSDDLSKNILVSASKNGFDPAAFEEFTNWISDTIAYLPSPNILAEMGMDGLVDTTRNQITYITPVTVPIASLTAVKANLRAVKGIEIFDRGELAESLLILVKDDFNFILFISAAIVFFTLLIVYGRIEIALLSFIPMVISWIWILGIAALLGIKFNFVNIIITTFIFGLGDDFSIFVTDGLLSKYKFKKDSLASYRSAILLSATTTIIGTGCLIFAKHPAIHSIAVISVLGICCILLISFFIQPLIFDFFIHDRIVKKKKPVDFLALIISINSFTYFLIGCLILHSILVTIILLPISKKWKRNSINTAISFFAKSVIYSGPHVKKHIQGIKNLNPSKPVIFIANHTSFLDILLVIMLHPKIVIMVKGWVYNSPFFGPIIRFAGYVYADHGPDQNLEQVKNLMADGYSLLIFPEGTRAQDGVIQRFHKGAFQMAEKLGCEIQPILIHGASEVLPKNDFLISAGELNLKILPALNITDIKWGNDLRSRTKNGANYFKEAFEEFKYEMETTDYLKHRIFSNYIFKGPILEWYFKVKWRLEALNFAYYESLIQGKSSILDLGCGYGYLSFYLHYKNPDRQIKGVDYDEEKIAIAQNSYNKTKNLQFIQSDIMSYDFKNLDVIFLNDILHYLSAEKQQHLLTNLSSALNQDGIIFIRDGITDFEKQHENTKWSEKLSTGIFGFNKKTEPFHFFNSNVIVDFAKKHQLSLEMIPQSKNTSNVLFILKNNKAPNM